MLRLTGAVCLIGAAWLAAFVTPSGAATDPGAPPIVAGGARDDCAVQLLQQWGARLRSHEAASSRLYAIYDRQLWIYDTSTPSAPVAIGEIELPFDANDISIRDGLAHLACGYDGATIVDVSDPTAPQLVSTYGADGSAYTIAVETQGTYAFVAGGPPLRVFDISNPYSPVLINDETALQSSFFYDIAVRGDLAAVSDCVYGCGLAFLDIADPAAPMMLDSLTQTHEYVRRVAQTDGYGFAVNYRSALLVVNATDPSDLDSIDWLSALVRDAATDGERLYVCSEPQLEIYALPQPPGPPVFQGQFDSEEVLLRLSLDGDVAYLATELGTIKIVDVGDPTVPAQVGAIPARWFSGLALNGRYAYVTSSEGGLSVQDIGQPTRPVVLGHAEGPGYGYEVTLHGQFALVSAGEAGVQVVDVSNPYNPMPVALVDPPGHVHKDVVTSGNLAYVAGGGSRSSVVDLTDPANPIVLGSFDTSAANAVAADPPYLYVADGMLGLLVIDVSDPTAPVRVARLVTGGGPHDIELVSHYAVVLTRTAGLQVVDISDPLNPVLSASLALTGYGTRLRLHGERAYAGTDDGALHIIDVSNLLAPVLLATEQIGGKVGSIAFRGPHMFIASHNKGLSVARWSHDGDLDGSGVVELGDLSALLTHFGQNGDAAYADGDLDGDGDVDLADLAALLGSFGLGC